MLIREAQTLFERDCQLRGLTKKTIVDYMDRIKYFQKETALSSVEDITPNGIEDYTLNLLNKSLSKGTIGNYLRPLKVFLRFLEREGIIDPDVGCSKSIKIPKMPVRKVDILTPEQIKLLFGDIDTSDVLSVRDALILALMLDSGLRRNEVITLEIRNINFANNTAKVCGKGDKERMVPIGQFTKQLIILYRRLSQNLRDKTLENKLLLLDRRGNPMSENAVKLMIARKQKLVDFDFCAHKLRHNFATNYCLDEYMRTGVMDIYKLKAIMGHSNLETTMIYMHLAQEIVAATTSTSHLDIIDLKL